MRMPRNLGPFHIIGIGGIGMSAIAEILRGLGYEVRGSDQTDGANVRRLRKKGIVVFVGHAAEHVEGAGVVVISTAVKPGNPELDAALAQGLPVISRAEILAEIMRLYDTVAITGTHGKTTTTSLTAHLLEAGEVDPTVITGGVVKAWDSNARLGEGNWMVVEADESDGTFLKLPTRIGVVTNIDPEHMDHYGSYEAIRQAFRQFFAQVPFYGLMVACVDHPEVRRILAEDETTNAQRRRRILTYGQDETADLQLESFAPNGGSVRFTVRLGPRVPGGARRLRDLVLPLPGRYNATNALAAMAVAMELGVEDDVIRKALAGFAGVHRRFTFTGSWNGVNVYDDYAHHPVEIAEVLEAARHAAKGRVIAVMQPHRYSRLQSFFDGFAACFARADVVLVAPVYAAGEKPIPQIDHERLAARIREKGHRRAMSLSGRDVLAPTLLRLVRPGDVIICLGAGDVSRWASELPSELASLANEPRRGASL